MQNEDKKNTEYEIERRSELASRAKDLAARISSAASPYQLVNLQNSLNNLLEEAKKLGIDLPEAEQLKGMIADKEGSIPMTRAVSNAKQLEAYLNQDIEEIRNTTSDLTGKRKDDFKKDKSECLAEFSNQKTEMTKINDNLEKGTVTKEQVYELDKLIDDEKHQNRKNKLKKLVKYSQDIDKQHENLSKLHDIVHKDCNEEEELTKKKIKEKHLSEIKTEINKITELKGEIDKDLKEILKEKKSLSDLSEKMQKNMTKPQKNLSEDDNKSLQDNIKKLRKQHYETDKIFSDIEKKFSKELSPLEQSGKIRKSLQSLKADAPSSIKVDPEIKKVLDNHSMNTGDNNKSKPPFVPSTPPRKPDGFTR